jgi:hypothetical protein
MKVVKYWQEQLPINHVPILLDSGESTLVYFTRRDILGELVPPIASVWESPQAQKLIKKQLADGSWEKSGAKAEIYPPWHYKLVETFKRFRILVEKYQFTRDHPVINGAAEFLFSCQTEEGDIRGFIGNQYATYYTGYVLSLLIRAGYEDDPRVEKGIDWLLSMRQNDGGWTIPILTRKYDRKTGYRLTSRYAETVEPNRAKPFSRNWTDMVLRALAAHSSYRKSAEAQAAGALLKATFFKPDAYSSYKSPRYWIIFAFWWPNLLTALESLVRLGFTKDDPDINRGLQWFYENQQPDGLWKLENHKEVSPRDREERLWLALSICRLLRKYYDLGG